MRFKLFLAFGTVILLSLLSNMAFRNLMLRDFEDYMRGDMEDRLYLILATLEGRAESGGWDAEALDDTAHWALLLGFEVSVVDLTGREIATTETFLERAGPMVRRRLAGLGAIPTRGAGTYQVHPLYLRGNVIGQLRIRESRVTSGRELRADVFRGRSRILLMTSVVGTGLGALIIGLLFIHYLLRPIRSLMDAVRRIQEGDLSARAVISRSSDEIGRLGQGFNSMVETLERQEQRQKNLVADLAHELRTPISIISATIEAVQDGVAKMDEKTLQSFHEETDRIRRLVAGIEVVAREETGYFFLNRREVDLRSLARLSAESLKPLYERKKLRLEFVTPDEPVYCHVDPDKMEQVVLNLLSNALRHTKAGEVRVMVRKEEGWVVLDVADTGPGIPEERRSLIFNRFHKGEDSDGLGIGLTIVRSIVGAHGGNVEVLDNPGGGSLFRVRLPQ